MTKYVWFDIETTGLDLLTSRLLEVGAILCDEHMEVVDTFHRVVWFPRISQWGLDEVIVNMHTESGLLAACAMRDDVSNEDEAWCDFIEWLGSNDTKGDIVPCGSGILHFDLPWIKLRAPDVARLFTYYAWDVGVLRRMAAWAGVPEFAAQNKAHRALDDARDALAEFMAIADEISPA